MTALREYEVTIGRNTTTMQLTEKSAQEYADLGYAVTPVQAKQIKDAQNKARTARHSKASQPPD